MLTSDHTLHFNDSFISDTRRVKWYARFVENYITFSHSYIYFWPRSMTTSRSRPSVSEFVRMNALTSGTRELRLDMKIPEAHKPPKTSSLTFWTILKIFHLIIFFNIFTDIQKNIKNSQSHFQLSKGYVTLAFSLFK